MSANPLSPIAKSDAAASVTSLEHATQDSAEPLLPALHAAAQKGDEELHRLLSSGADANERDAQNITALHWAAINNCLLACKDLLEHGAEVDSVGGELEATPMQWAARNGHIYIVHLLISHGADPSLTDAQGFDTFHLAIHSSSPMLVAYLLSQQLPVATDAVDRAGRTCLQWAAYQGDGISVDLMLRHGADPNKKDPGGLTALHWAVVKGNVTCISKILTAGGDPTIKNAESQTPYELARQLNSVQSWQRAMHTSHREVDGRTKPKPLSEKNSILAIGLLPTALLYTAFKTFSILPWYTALPVAVAEWFGVHHVIVRVLLDAKGSDDRVMKSPYLAGVLGGSIILVGWTWVSTLVGGISGHATSNLIFAISYLVCAYNFIRALTLDPGNIPKSQGPLQTKEVVEELVTAGAFSSTEFCLPCMTRKPLRSKHCRICNRCVARHDHHCPWIWNCVGVNNHRQFILFVFFLIIGILSFDRLAYAYFSQNTPSPATGTTEEDSLCLFPQPICAAAQFDTFTFCVVLWSTIQLTWTSIVLAGQAFQICRQLTTYELSNLGRHGYMSGKPHSPSAERLSAIVDHEGMPHRSHQHTFCVEKIVPAGLLSALGLDLYTRGKAVDGITVASSNAGKRANPFDLGFMRNCSDFWTRGRTLGVDYTSLYTIPDEGFVQPGTKRRRSEKKAGSQRYEMLNSEDV